MLKAGTDGGKETFPGAAGLGRDLLAVAQAGGVQGKGKVFSRGLRQRRGTRTLVTNADKTSCHVDIQGPHNLAAISTEPPLLSPATSPGPGPLCQ